MEVVKYQLEHVLEQKNLDIPQIEVKITCTDGTEHE